MSKTTTNTKGLLERLKAGETIICAEGYLFEFERRGYLKAGGLVPEIVLDNPEVLTQLHREFARAGSDVIEAFTYYGHRDKLALIGREDDLEPLNRQALRLAKKVADEYGLLFAGNICNTWAYDPAQKKESSEVVRDMYVEQVQWASEAGVDYVIAETISDLGEAEVALEVIQAFELPSVITLAVNSGEHTTNDGYDIVEACKILCEKGADVVGLNCELGPVAILPLLKEISASVDCYVAGLPVATKTSLEEPLTKTEGFPTDLDSLICTRNEFAEFAKQATEAGVQYIGTCCYAGPHHVRSIAEVLGRKPEASKYSPDMSLRGTLRSQKREAGGRPFAAKFND